MLSATETRSYERSVVPHQPVTPAQGLGVKPPQGAGASVSVETLSDDGKRNIIIFFDLI